MHIEDLMLLYLKLVEAAAAGGKGADWGKEVGLIDLPTFPRMLTVLPGLLLRCYAGSVADRYCESCGQGFGSPEQGQEC